MTKAARRITVQAQRQTPLVQKQRGDFRTAWVRSNDAEKAIGSLAEFAKQAWHVVEPETELIWNWHLDAVCEHLEAFFRGRIRRMVINVPPGTAKSTIAMVLFPAWAWLERPSWRLMGGSYAMDLAIRDAVRSRDVMESDWYQDTFRPDWKFSTSQNVKSRYKNTATGERIAVSVGSKVTGFRANDLLVDDGMNVMDARSALARMTCHNWWDKAMSSRTTTKGGRAVIEQRTHEEDLSGHCLAKGGYEHLCLPTEYEPERACSTSIGFTDPRTDRGELLFPALFTPEVIAQAKLDLGSDGFAGQHQQRPAAAEGSIFKRRWWRFWLPTGVTAPPVEVLLDNGEIHRCETVVLPDTFDDVAQSWDMTFKDTAGSDFVAGGVWAKKGADRFLLDQLLERLAFTETCAALSAMHARWPQARRILVEDKANGPAVISALRSRIPGLIPVEPEGGKIARAQAVSPLVEAGNVYLPHPMLFKWVSGFISTAADFPFVAKDDEVDQMTQILNYWAGYRPKLSNLV